MVARGWDGRGRGTMAKGYGVSFWGEEKIFKIECGADYTTL